MSIEWLEDNSMLITQTLVAAGVENTHDGAEVVATFENVAGEVVGDPIALSPTENANEFAATVHPTGDYDLPRIKHRLRIVGTYGGATFETEEIFTPRIRRS